jgi:hypothetical protein
MSEDRRKSCLVCAWRANCAKRFSMGDDATLHCPDYCEDITLRKRPVAAEPQPDGEVQP